jgi:iron(III) transport system permease protein
VALCLLGFALGLLWPIALTLRGGFVSLSPGGGAYTLEHVAAVFSDPALRAGLVNSLIIAFAVTALSLLIGLPLAVLNTAFKFRGQTLMSALVLAPLILPPFVGAIGVRQMLGRFGAANTLLSDWGLIDPANPVDFLGSARLLGVILIEALHLYPIIYLNASAALSNLDPALGQAAQNLGASRWTRFRRVTLPLIRPGLFAGATIVWVWAFTELGTPLMFDYYNVMPVQVFWGIQEMASDPQPYALVAVMLTVAIGAYVVGKVIFGAGAYAMSNRAAHAHAETRLTGLASMSVCALFLVVTAVALLPHLGVALSSVAEPGSWYRSVTPGRWTLDHFTGALTHPLASTALHNSFLYALAAMALDILAGLTLAWLIVRSRTRLAGLLDALAMLPLAVPGLVLAFGYVAVSIQISGWYQSAGAEPPALLRVLGENPNPILFLVIAYAVRRLPYVVRAAVAGLQQTSGQLEEAAANLGAGALTTLRRVTLPLIAANIIAGGILAFAFAMLEVSDSLVLAQTERHYPLTKAIYILFQRLGDGPYIASAMGVWAMALLALTLVAAAMMLGKKMGAIFRL